MANDPYYKTARWIKLRAATLTSQPFCAYCNEVGDTTPSTVADHIIPRAKRPDLESDMNNLQGLCKQCHDSIKAREESQGKRIGVDRHGNPRGGWDA